MSGAGATGAAADELPEEVLRWVREEPGYPRIQFVHHGLLLAAAA